MINLINYNYDKVMLNICFGHGYGLFTPYEWIMCVVDVN